MLEITFCYTGFLSDGKYAKLISRGTKVVREKSQPRFPSSKIKCDLDNVDLILSSLDRPIKVYWSKDVFGANGNILRLLEKGYREIALITIGDDHTWVMRAEPTMDGQVGLTVFDQKNQVRLIGVGDVVEVNHRKTRAYHFIATYREVYSWGSRNPRGCEHFHAGHNKHAPTTQPIP